LLCIPSQAVQVDSDEEEEEDDEDDEDFAEEEEELMNEHTGSGRSAAESASAFSSPRVTVFADPLRGEDPVALAELEGDSFYWPSARKRSLSGSFGMTDEDIGESSFSFSFSLFLSLSLSLSLSFSLSLSLSLSRARARSLLTKCKLSCPGRENDPPALERHLVALTSLAKLLLNCGFEQRGIAYCCP
jgi:hypothetical protein